MLLIRIDVAPNSQLVLGASLKIIEDDARQDAPRLLPHVLNRQDGFDISGHVIWTGLLRNQTERCDCPGTRVAVAHQFAHLSAACRIEATSKVFTFLKNSESFISSALACTGRVIWPDLSINCSSR